MPLPKLQLALDLLDLSSALALAHKVADQVDLIEAGTPFIKRVGVSALAHLRVILPNKLLVADMKTIDAGEWEAELAFAAFADLMTVLGCASDATIGAALEVAHRYDKQVVVDLLGVNDKPKRARQLAQLGVDFIGIHTASDDQRRGAHPLADLAAVRQAVDTPLVVAGGVKPEKIPALLAHQPAILVVGSYITHAQDPIRAATAIRNAMSVPSEKE